MLALPLMIGLLSVFAVEPSEATALLAAVATFYYLRG